MSAKLGGSLDIHKASNISKLIFYVGTISGYRRSRNRANRLIDNLEKYGIYFMNTRERFNLLV